jgi:hypothetical protein
MFNSPNTAAMMGTVAMERRGVAAGARTLLQNTGAVISIAFVIAIVTASVPKDILFKIISGVSQGLSPDKLDPFVTNLHNALWVLAATSLIGAAVSLLRPAHTQPSDSEADERLPKPKLAIHGEIPTVRNRPLRNHDAGSSS